jgi:hypothetical protein
VAEILQELSGEPRPGIFTEELASFAKAKLEADRQRMEALSATLRGLGSAVPEAIDRARQLLDRIRSDDDSGCVTSLDAGRSDLKDGVKAARHLQEILQDDENLQTLRSAGSVLGEPPLGLSESAARARELGLEILRSATYAGRFAELRGALEQVTDERQRQWREAREELEQALAQSRSAVGPLLAALPEAEASEFDREFRALELADASYEKGPSRDAILAGLARITPLIERIRAALGRSKGREVVRVRVGDLFSEPVKDEDDLEVLLERIRNAAEEAIAEGKFFLLS